MTRQLPCCRVTSIKPPRGSERAGPRPRRGDHHALREGRRKFGRNRTIALDEFFNITKAPGYIEQKVSRGRNTQDKENFDRSNVVLKENKQRKSKENQQNFLIESQETMKTGNKMKNVTVGDCDFQEKTFELLQK